MMAALVLDQFSPYHTEERIISLASFVAFHIHADLLLRLALEMKITQSKTSRQPIGTGMMPAFTAPPLRLKLMSN